MDKTTLAPSMSIRELGIGVAAGVAVGVAFGMASNNYVLGVSVGAILGVGFGGVLNWYNNLSKSKSL